MIAWKRFLAAASVSVLFCPHTRADDPSVELEARCGYALNGGTYRVTFDPVVLSSKGRNARRFPMTASWDSSNAIVLSLHRTSDESGNPPSVKYTLYLARAQNPVERATLCLECPREKARGRMSSSVVFHYGRHRGFTGASYLLGGELYSMNGGGLHASWPPAPLAIRYSVRAGRLLRRQEIHFSCDIRPREWPSGRSAVQEEGSA